ncbi:MAG TPA: GNAT family N-acetyltransferase [Niabella sp.]|nr:GNAT family N-acetyltransferase [Niabella sp.]HOZ97836.1 GNAT family N-acetyltransferase [Niabella sp.]HQW15675.1 GNAT family N-acetyltransferase [Niabella sp.]HQX20808.1 GNAT family N-acetyltransferase [Niabella sp.]HQX41393.1 GNAT family N-acetyltransferase [Niabella sp.]
MNIEIKKLSPQDIDDFSELIRIFEEVFEMDNFKMPDEKHLQSLLSKPDFFTLVAKYDNKVLGGLTVYILHRYFSTKPIAYIYDIGVIADYQRKGIGKKLIAYLTNYCKENGFEDAYVDAETDDTQAVNFYRTTSFNNELQATQFTYSFDKANKDNGK